MNAWKKVFVVAAIGAFLAVGSVQASTIIYQDTFTGINNDSGTPPTSSYLCARQLETRLGDYGGSATATWDAAWSGSYVWTQSGTQATKTATSGSTVYDAYVPFTPQTGYVYTLSADISATSSYTDRWMGVGFNDNNTRTEMVSSSAAGAAGTILLCTTSTPSITYGGGTLGMTGAGVTVSNPSKLTVILDTTDALNYKFTFKVSNTDGSNVQTIASNVAYGSAPTIHYIDLCSHSKVGGYVDNFKLTVDVPEPSTLALLGAGLVGLLAYAWRKRK
jgi:hypothetical protein